MKTINVISLSQISTSERKRGTICGESIQFQKRCQRPSKHLVIQLKQLPMRKKKKKKHVSVGNKAGKIIKITNNDTVSLQISPAKPYNLSTQTAPAASFKSLFIRVDFNIFNVFFLLLLKKRILRWLWCILMWWCLSVVLRSNKKIWWYNNNTIKDARGRCLWNDKQQQKN